MTNPPLPPGPPASPAHPPNSGRGFLLLIGAGLLWGTSGPAGHLLQFEAGMAPLAVATYRLLIGGALVMAYVTATGRLRRTARTRAVARRLGLNALLHIAFQSLFFGSLALIPVGLSSVIKIGSVPVFVGAGVCLLARRRPPARLTAAVVLALAGLALLAGFPSAGLGGWPLSGGLACALGAGLAFSVMTLLNRRPVPGLDPLVNVGAGLTLGGVLLLPAGLVAGMAVPVTVDGAGLLLYLGLVPTALAYLAYFGGLRTATDAATAVGTLAEPLTAGVISVIFLGEHVTAPGVAGMLLLGLAMLADYLPPRRRRY